MLARTLGSVVVTLCITLSLGACGWFTDESPDLVDVGVNPLPGDDDDFGNPDDGDPELPDPVAENEINLQVRATSGMLQATVAQRLWNWLTPTAALATESGEALITGVTLAIEKYGPGDQQLEAVISPADYVVVVSGDNALTIRFAGGLPDRLDHVITATLPNGVKLRHPLPSESQSIRIDAVSEYAVRRFFNAFTDQTELFDLGECENSDSNCSTQRLQRILYLQGMVNGLQDFELSIPGNLDLEEAVEFLGTQYNLAHYATRTIEAVRDDQLNAVSNGQVSPVVQNRGGQYRSVYYALGLNQNLQSGQRSLLFSNRNSTVRESVSGTAGVVQYVYPGMIFTPTFLGVLNNLFNETYPFERRTLERTANGGWLTGSEPENPDKVLFTGSTISFLNRTGFFDLARLQIQAITRETSRDPLGWLTNPHYLRMYTLRNPTSAEGSDSMASAFWSDGQLIQLAARDQGFERQSINELQHTFGWVFHSLATDRDDAFELSTIEGKKYVAIGFGSQFEFDPVIQWTSEIEYWQADSGQIQISQPGTTSEENGGGQDIFNTVQLSRDAEDRVVGPSATQVPLSTPEPLRIDPQLVYRNDTGNYEEQSRGRILIGEHSGISDPSGNLLSVLRANGEGIVHAVRVSDEVPDLTNAVFRLYGNSVSASADQTRYHNHNETRLVFEDGVARLQMQEATASADHSSLLVEPVRDTSADWILQPEAIPASIGNIRNQLVLSFPDPKQGGIPLQLEGMAGSGGKLLVLRMRYGSQIGLLYGFREQELTEASP